MKLTKKDLDDTLVSKIERLDGIVDSFVSRDRSGFVAYDGEKFSIKRVNDLFMRKVITYDELQEYRKRADLPENLSKSFLLDSVNNRSRYLSYEGLEAIQSLELEDEINLIKQSGDFVYVLTTTGKLLRITQTLAIESEINLLQILERTFTFENFYGNDLLCFEIVEEGIIVSTRKNGVFLIKDDASAEIIFDFNNVLHIMGLSNGKALFTLEKNNFNTVLVDYRRSLKIESFNVMKKAGNQQPYKALRYANFIFILGKTYGLEQSTRMIHIWTEDENGYLKNIDGLLPRNEMFEQFRAFGINVSSKKLYLNGTIDKIPTLFVYDLENLDRRPEIIQYPDYSADARFIEVHKGKVFYNMEQSLIVRYLNGEILFNIKLDKKITGIQELLSGFLLTGKNTLQYIELPQVKEVNSVELVLYNEDVFCNNIEVLVEFNSAPSKVLVELADKNQGVIITPYSVVEDGNDLFIKLVGVPADLITAKFSFSDDNYIKKVYVNPNRVYIR